MAQRDWVEKDYYKILGVPKAAGKDEIKRAYRKLAHRYHPDANKGDKQAESRFKEISEAHSVLSNDKKRAEYDEMRRLFEAGGERIFGFGPDRGGGVRVNVGDLFGDGGEGAGLFEDLLGGFGFRGRAGRGRDVETEVTLAFDEAVSGTTVTLGDGTRVRIPAGVSNGARIKVSGKGAAGAPDGAPGDLYVRVKVREHPVFKTRKNGDLLVMVPVTFTEAALGANVAVPTLNGPVTVKVPAGSPNGKTLRVKGKGAPRRNGGSGDLLVKLDVQVPNKLSKKERELLEQFGEVHKASPREHLKQYMESNAARTS
jgi:molecular chaperone DnaJ